MAERGRGAVLNLASLIAFQPVPFQATYGATKAFVLSFTDALHEEMRGTGVTLTAVCPGPVRTEFGEAGGFGGADERIPDALWLDAERVAADALRAVERGDRVTVPGPATRSPRCGASTCPRSCCCRSCGGSGPLARAGCAPAGRGRSPTPPRRSPCPATARRRARWPRRSR